ncbi:putative ribonuclease H-like domain-containing protein [Tanacetum coccineum]
MAGEDEFHDDNPPPPPPVTPTQQAPHTLSTIKLPILKKGEYDIWAMKMEHYLGHTDYPIWEVIQKGNGPVQVSTDTNGQIRVLPPKTAEEILARERERKARTTLLMAIPEDHLAKFHKMTDAKEMWEAIKSRFGGNDESKKMQKYILKQQFESFSVSNSKGLHKGYDRFQSLLSQLEIHGAGVSTEDANQKFLRVFESDIKGTTASSSSTQNVAFVSSESTNKVSSSYTNELKYSFFANQSSGPQLDHEDLEQVDEFDLEEMDLKWQVAMISMRLKKFYKKTGRRLQFDAKEPVGFDKTKVECFNCHNTGHFARECRSKGNQESRRRDAGNTGYKAKDNGRRPGKQEEPKALVTLDGEGVDWTGHAEDEQENFALMAYSNSGSDTEVTSCSKECVESYAKLKKLYDEQREQLGDASIEIQAYTQALKKVEAQLVAHQKNQLWYEEKIRFMKIDLDDKTDVLTYHKKLLAEAVKEKEELKTKLENFQSSSKGLSKLLNSQMSTRDKSGLGYGNQIHEGVLSYENEVFQSVFDSRSSDVEDSPVYDRFAKVEGMHAVPPPMTGNYMPPKSDFGIDESNFTYGLKQSKTSESDAKTSDFNSCETNSSVETLEFVPEPVVVEPKVVSQPKVWSDAPIIEEYESDSDDEYVIKPSKEQEKPSFAFVNTVKHVKTPRETVKEQNTCSPSPKVNKRDCNGLMSKKLDLGYGFNKKACFVCGSFNHLIRDCDFHEKRMAKQVELNKQKGKGTGQGENRPVWNNVQRLNHQNKFVPKAVLTKTGIFSVNTAIQNPFSQAAETSTAIKVNTARPIMNEIRQRNNFYKSHSPIRRLFNKSTAPKANFTNHKVNTARDKIVSVVRGYRETAIKASDDPQIALKDTAIFLTVDASSLNHELWGGQYETSGIDGTLYKPITATARTSATGEEELTATIDGQEKTITEASLRIHLKLEDDGGVTALPNSKIFEQLALMGFIQSVWTSKGGLLQPYTRTYSTPVLTQKVFSNMKRVTKGYFREDTPLFASMITESETSPSRITSLIKKVKKLEQTVKTRQSRRRTRVEKISDDTEVLLEGEDTAELVEEPTKLVEDQGSGEKGEQEVTTADTALNTASVPISTASATPEVSTAAVNLVYIRRSAEKRKYKGKAIMIEDESVQKKSQNQLEQERLSHEEAIRLQEQIDEEERKRIARDAEIAKQLQEEYDKAGKEEAVAEVDTAHVIDWNDPSGGYKMKDFKGMSYDDIRLIFEKVWDQVHSFVPMDSEEEVQRLKRAGQDVEAKPAKRQRTEEVSEDDLVKLWSLVQERYNSSGLTEDKEIELTRYIHAGGKGLSTNKGTCNFDAITARPISTDSTKIESMKLEAMVEERRIFKCWFHYHTKNGHQFTMFNRHQKLASPEQTASGKDFSNSANGYCCVARLLRCCNEKLKNFKISKSSSSSKKGLKNRSVFEYILLTFKKLILKKHEVSLDLSRLATTLKRLERSNQIGINKDANGAQGCSGTGFGEAVLDLDTAGALQFQLGEVRHRISSAVDFLGIAPSYTSIRDPMLRLCHRLITCSIAGRSQAPMKVLERLTVIVQDLPEIDTSKLVAAAGTAEAAEDAPVVDEAASAVPAPKQAPQPPPPVVGPARTMAQRLGRLEEDVHGLRGALGEQREVLDSMAYDFSRFTTWTVIGLSQMMD